MEKKQYTQPLCTVNEILPLRMMAASNRIKVNNGNAVYDIGGDVNRNEDYYDVWDNLDVIP